MRKVVILLLLVALLHSMEIVQNLEVPQTHIGN